MGKKFTHFIRNAADKAKNIFRNIFDRYNEALNVAFPKTEIKYLVIGLMVFVCLLAAYIIAYFQVGVTFSADGVQVNTSISSMIVEYWIRDVSFPFLGYLIFCILVWVALYAYLIVKAGGNTGRGFNIAKSNTYGSAREINEEKLAEVAEIVPKEQAVNTILGQMDLTEERLITTKDNPNSNGNILVIGPPGSGKSFCFVKPTICQIIRRGESAIVTDTKGECYADTVEYARLHGYKTIRLDLKNPEYSSIGWQVLSEMRCDDNRALIMAQIIINCTGSPDDIHKGAEESLLRALCLYVERSRMIPPEEKTLYSALAMLFQEPDALDMVFEDIKFDDEMRVAYDAYASFVRGSKNLRGNIVTGLANRLSILTSPPVKQLTSTPGLELAELGKTPTILYLVTSDQHETMKFLASLLYSYAFLDLVELADAQLDRKLPVPVTFLMEEFANLGEVPNIDKYLSTCRSRKINIMMIIQSLAQLRSVYGEEKAEIIMADCATHLALGYNDKSTSEYYEWRSGESTIDAQTDTHTHGESPISLGRRYTKGEGRRNLYTAHELMTLEQGEVYIVWQRTNCLKAKSFGINRHPATLNGEMTTISTEVKVKLSNKKAREFIQRKEEERVAAYREWIQQGGNPWQDYGVPAQTFGPATGTKPPAVIPYPELEEMALAYAGSDAEKQSDMLSRIQRSNPIPAITFTEEFNWKELSEDEIEDDTGYENDTDDTGNANDGACSVPDKTADIVGTGTAIKSDGRSNNAPRTDDIDALIANIRSADGPKMPTLPNVEQESENIPDSENSATDIEDENRNAAESPNTVLNESDSGTLGAESEEGQSMTGDKFNFGRPGGETPRNKRQGRDAFSGESKVIDDTE